MFVGILSYLLNKKVTEDAAKAVTKSEHGGWSGATYSNQTYKDVIESLHNQGYEVQDPITQIESMQRLGLITDKDYELGIKYFEKYKKREGKDTNIFEKGWDAFKDLFSGTSGSAEQAQALKNIAEASLHYEYPNANNVEEWLETVTSNALNGIAPPRYQAMLDPNADQLPVPNAKWYTGQEMADLFNINYDPNYYYDLLKKSTEAQVTAQDFKNEQAIANSMADDAVSRNQYLQSIDNTKADAVIKGSTLGARMANELLANANAANTYATNQANVYNQALTDIQPLIQKNALAKETANKYFNQNVFSPIGENIEKLYYDDIVNRGAYLNYNANQYAAALAANGQIAQANAAMDAAYQTAVGQATATANEYKYVYDLYRKAANLRPELTNDRSRENWAALNFDDYIQNRNNPNNTGATS